MNEAASIKEVFFDFSYVATTTGLTVATTIKESLCSHNVDTSKARGQAYDGASAMSSDRCGVQAQIRKSAPMAIYTHCRSHAEMYEYICIHLKQFLSLTVILTSCR